MRRGSDRQIDRHTDGRDHYTLRLGYASREMYCDNVYGAVIMVGRLREFTRFI